MIEQTINQNLLVSMRTVRYLLVISIIIRVSKLNICINSMSKFFLPEISITN